MTEQIKATPLTWDELCKLASKFEMVHYFLFRYHDIKPCEIGAAYVQSLGKIRFEAGVKYWRSKESLEAWIDQQKGDLK